LREANGRRHAGEKKEEDEERLPSPDSGREKKYS